jgi:hypothetical protein
MEKIVFDIGLLAILAVFDRIWSANFIGIALWYVGYLVINSFGHANFELKPVKFNLFLARVLTSATYHSLHHSRYTGNYGLGTSAGDFQIDFILMPDRVGPWAAFAQIRCDYRPEMVHPAANRLIRDRNSRSANKSSTSRKLKVNRR